MISARLTYAGGHLPQEEREKLKTEAAERKREVKESERAARDEAHAKALRYAARSRLTSDLGEVD